MILDIVSQAMNSCRSKVSGTLLYLYFKPQWREIYLSLNKYWKEILYYDNSVIKS